MQNVSAAYKQTMKELFRGKTYMRVSLGLINQKAQSKANVEESSFTYYSNTEAPLNNEDIEHVYAAYENNYNLVDGSMRFLPREDSGENLFNEGIVTENLIDENGLEVTIRLDVVDPITVKGMTINFGNTWPDEFMLITDQETKIYTNDKVEFVTEDVFENITFLTIKATSMKNGIGRLHIHKILFGIGIYISDSKIMSANMINKISPIAEKIPTSDFSVTVDNLDQYYNVDNVESAINFIETGQQLEVYVGQKLTNGSVEWVPGGLLYMKKWSADDRKATFKAVDIFEYMQDEYKKGSYYENGISLYDLSEAVFLDAGVEQDMYWIDPYLKNEMVKNPLPIATHKECLQMIANAGRCVMSQNREGIIIIKTSFVPEITISVNQEESYGTIQNILDGKLISYASNEKDFVIPGNGMTFIPRDMVYQDGEYVSTSMSDISGMFDVNPIITVAMEAAYTFYNLAFYFGNVWPEEMIIRKYNDGVLIGTLVINDITKDLTVNHNFINVDQVQIEFAKAVEFNKIHIQKISLGEETDYEMSYDILKKSPVGKKLEKIKDLSVVRSVYTKGTEIKSLISDEITMDTSADIYEFEFSHPSHDISVNCYVDEVLVDYGAQIEESGAYWCRVRINNPPQVETVVNIVISGYIYSISSVSKTRKINTFGINKKWANPLVSELTHAEKVLTWLEGHFAVENEYDLSYRGDAALDVNDVIFLENKYMNDMKIRVETTKLNYNGSLSGSIKGRRYG